MPYVRRLLALVFLLCGVALGPVGASAQAARGPLLFAEVDGTLTSVTVGYLRRALHLAEASDASALVIRLGSSGGVLRDIRPFAMEIAEARVPVVVYVSPPGTQSGAAGALFLSTLSTVITALSLSQGLRSVIQGSIIVMALLLQGQQARARKP